jgi:L-fuconolactonase
MPAFPIIDTHLHLWDPGRLRYSWQKGNALLNRPYHVEDYQRDTVGVAIEAMVFLECYADPGQYLEELEFAAEEAERDPRIQAFVPTAPLERGSEITALVKNMIERFPKIRGIRRIVEFDEKPRELMLSSKFIAGVNFLESLNLHFEINVNYTQMDGVLEFVGQVPNARLILDHCGKPGIRGGHIQEFRLHMKELARHENVYCKLSDLPVEADHQCWTDAQLRPFVDATLESFGVDRVIYGGDWPVCLQATSLPRWVETLDRAFVALSEDELRKIYRDNASRFYRLNHAQSEGARA